MAEKRIQDWLNTAVSGIRFWLDREKVEEELRGHLEDKTADLQRIFHLSREEAEEMALKQMGDAKEIGKELSRIHRPWLGRLWLVSQIMVICLVILTAAQIVRWDDDDWAGVKRRFVGMEYSATSLEGPWFWVRDDGCDYVRVIELDVPEIQVGQYRISARRAELWEYDGFADAPDGYRVVYLELDVAYDRPWEEPYGLQTYLWAEDDAGTHFLSKDEVRAMAELSLQRRNYVPGSGNEEELELEHELEVYGEGFGPFGCTYLIILRNVSMQAQEVTLHYDEMGAEFVLPITLEGEGETWVKN